MMNEKWFIIERLFPSGKRRVKLEINGEVIDTRVGDDAKAMIRALRIEHKLVRKHFLYAWL